MSELKFEVQSYKSKDGDYVIEKELDICKSKNRRIKRTLFILSYKGNELTESETLKEAKEDAMEHHARMFVTSAVLSNTPTVTG